MELGNAVQLSLQRNSNPYEVAKKLPLYFGKERLDVEVSCSNSNINNYTRDIFLQLHKKHSSVLALHFCAASELTFLHSCEEAVPFSKG